MFVIKLFCVFYIFVTSCNCAILLWSNKKFDYISPFKQFNYDDLDEITKQLNHPDVFIFKNPTTNLSPIIKQVTENHYSVYNGNGVFDVENATDLLGNGDLDLLKIQEALNDRNKQNDFVSVIIIPEKRIKRETTEEQDDEPSTETTIQSSSTTPETPPTTFKIPSGPILYKVQLKKDNSFALMYTSKPLKLKINDTQIHLGSTNSDMITVDTRLTNIITSVSIPLEDGDKVTLRFNFIKNNGYWSLTSVKITDTNNKFNFNLTAMSNIAGPVQFSYHCSGETVFSDLNNTVALYLYDLQVQIDSKNGKFGPANDCVPFITIPIWSGLFVTFILGIGLTIALIAIMDIKTMDKFDNQKTKNLSITVSE